MGIRIRIIGLVVLSLAVFGVLFAGNVNTSRTPGSQAASGSRPPHSDTPPATATASPTADPDGRKILVVFFSRTGENYPNLNLTVGNTARLAGFIHARVGGDTYEIVPADPYSNSYEDTTERAQREQDDEVYPSIKGALPDVAAYDTVFLGYPIWWGEQPQIVKTFMRDSDLNQATIIPFATHEGSGFGNSLSTISDYYPDSKILDGLAERGSDVADSPTRAKRTVDSWLSGLGFS